MPESHSPAPLALITPDRWGRVASVFDHAFSLDDAARASFLERECDGDDALRAQVEQMLRAADAPAAFFDAFDVIPDVDAPIAASLTEPEPDEVTAPAQVPESEAPTAVTPVTRPARRRLVAVGVILLVALAGAMALAWRTRVATAQAASAERRLSDVHTLARSVLARYLDAIETLAASKPVRERFVRDGLAYLDQLSARRNNDRALQLELAEAYRRSADLQGGAHAGNLGDTAGAIASVRRAVAILDPLMTSDPGDAGARTALSAALQTLGVLLRTTGDLPQARAAMERVVLLIGTPPAAEARDPAIALSLHQQHHDLGQVLSALGDTAAARRELNTALAALDAIPDGARTRPAVRDAYAATLQQLADLTATAGQPEVAWQAVRRVVALRQAMVTAEPTNRAYQRALLLAHEREGKSLAGLGRYADAMGSYRSASQLAETLLRGDRANAQYRTDAARALVHLGDMSALAGNVEGAILFFQSSLELHRQGQRADTANVPLRVAMIDVEARLARSHARLQRTTEALSVLARAESSIEATRVDSGDVVTRSAFGDTYASLAEAYMTLRGQGAVDELSAGICRKAGQMFDRAEVLLADLLTRERASTRDSTRLVSARSLRAASRQQCPAG